MKNKFFKGLLISVCLAIIIYYILVFLLVGGIK